MSSTFWKPNIGTAGRIVRLLCALALFASAGYRFYQDGLHWWPVVLALLGLFTLIEALRGWCVLRACKLRTPL